MADLVHAPRRISAHIHYDYYYEPHERVNLSADGCDACCNRSKVGKGIDIIERRRNHGRSTTPTQEDNRQEAN